MPQLQCAKCGTSIPERAAFCPECGTPTPAHDADAGVPGNNDLTRADLPVSGHDDASPQTGVLPAVEDAPSGEPPAPAPAWQAPPQPSPAWQAPPPPPPPPSAQPTSWQTPPDGSTPGAAGPWQAPGAASQPTAQPWPSQPQYGAVAAAPPKGSRTGSPAGALLGLVGSILAIVAVWLVWIKVTIAAQSSTATGWKSSNDAKILLGIGIAAALVSVALFATRPVLLRLLLLAAGLGALAIGIRDLLDVGRVADDIKKAGQPITGHSAGIGLYLVLAAGVLLLLGGLAAFIGGSKAGNQRS